MRLGEEWDTGSRKAGGSSANLDIHSDPAKWQSELSDAQDDSQRAMSGLTLKPESVDRNKKSGSLPANSPHASMLLTSNSSLAQRSMCRHKPQDFDGWVSLKAYLKLLAQAHQWDQKEESGAWLVAGFRLPSSPHSTPEEGSAARHGRGGISERGSMVRGVVKNSPTSHTRLTRCFPSLFPAKTTLP